MGHTPFGGSAWLLLMRGLEIPDSPCPGHAEGNDSMAVGQKVVMPALERALDAESYEWLATNQPDILTAIETEIGNGHTPEQIKWRVLRRTNRLEIAMRCEQAARHILAMAA